MLTPSEKVSTVARLSATAALASTRRYHSGLTTGGIQAAFQRVCVSSGGTPTSAKASKALEALKAGNLTGDLLAVADQHVQNGPT